MQAHIKLIVMKMFVKKIILENYIFIKITITLNCKSECFRTYILLFFTYKMILAQGKTYDKITLKTKRLVFKISYYLPLIFTIKAEPIQL